MTRATLPLSAVVPAWPFPVRAAPWGDVSRTTHPPEGRAPRRFRLSVRVVRQAAVGLLLLSGGPLAAQDVPAPGNYRGALARADSLYQEAITLVEDARDAFERGDGVALGAAVRAYRRVMPYALVWHGRACWAADFGRRRVGRPGVAYPMQAVMGETWSGWNTASVYMAEGAEELLREVSAAALDSHAATLHAVVDEMRGCVR